MCVWFDGWSLTTRVSRTRNYLPSSSCCQQRFWNFFETVRSGDILFQRNAVIAFVYMWIVCATYQIFDTETHWKLDVASLDVDDDVSQCHPFVWTDITSDHCLMCLLLSHRYTVTSIRRSIDRCNIYLLWLVTSICRNVILSSHPSVVMHPVVTSSCRDVILSWRHLVVISSCRDSKLLRRKL